RSLRYWHSQVLLNLSGKCSCAYTRPSDTRYFISGTAGAKKFQCGKEEERYSRFRCIYKHKWVDRKHSLVYVDRTHFNDPFSVHFQCVATDFTDPMSIGSRANSSTYQLQHGISHETVPNPFQ